jgi:hypothetical protein
MTMTTGKTPRKMPKGGRKGGAIFPRVGLVDAIAYAKKLVSKTHVSAQPADVIYSGVVGAKSGKGQVRVSALKQYGFLKGDNKAGFSADELAKQIVAAPAGEMHTHYRRAALRPKIFKALFDTFHGDIVTKAKLRQRAADLNVHPEELDACVETYVAAMELAGLASVDGDQVKHRSVADIEQLAASVDEDRNDSGGDADEAEDEGNGIPGSEGPEDEDIEAPLERAKAIFHVNVNLDSSLDTDKLAKQLELLKRFGAI